MKDSDIGRTIGHAILHAAGSDLRAVDIHTQLASSIDAMRIAEILTSRGVNDERALRYAEMVITMCEAATHDAAIWNAAERLFRQMEPIGEDHSLIHAPSRVRQFYLVCAMHTIKGFEMVLTGLLNRDRVCAAYADYQSHRETVIARTSAKRLGFPKDVSGNAVEESA